MRAYKGFDKDMRCRGFQYKEGETYEEKEAIPCKCGFHACEDPLYVLTFYPPGKGSKYHVVELEDVAPKKDADYVPIKRVGKKITILEELSYRDMVREHEAYVLRTSDNSKTAVVYKGCDLNDEKNIVTSASCNGGMSKTCNFGASASGDYGVSQTGEYGSASVLDMGSVIGERRSSVAAGESSIAITGDFGNACVGSNSVAMSGLYGVSASGNESVSLSCDYGISVSGGMASVGAKGIAVARGEHCKARGGANALLILVKTNPLGDILFHNTVKVDGTIIRENTWYKLNDDGIIVECEEE